MANNNFDPDAPPKEVDEVEDGIGVQIFVSATNLKNLDFFTLSDPQCSLKSKSMTIDYAPFKHVGDTEVIDNHLSPCWIKHFTVSYIFEKDKELWFQVYNFNTKNDRDLIGETKVLLSSIMVSSGMTIERDLFIKEKPGEDRGRLKIWADTIKKTSDSVKFQINGSLRTSRWLCFGSDNPYLLIERARQKRSAEDDMVKVYRSDNKFDCNPWWDVQQITMPEFCNCNKYLPIKLSVYSYVNSGEHPCYGSVTTTTRDIEMLPDKRLTIKNSKGEENGYIQFNQFDMDMKPSLINYLKDGWAINVSLAIDFTLSNLEITDYRSLHRKSDKEPNVYEKAIFEVCNVMTPYARNGKFQAFGFGGIPLYMGHTKTARIWNLNNEEEAWVEGRDGVLKAYQHAINGIQLAGPTYFFNILDKVRSQIFHQFANPTTEEQKVYHLVIFITDGNCHDMEATKKTLVQLSGMPFSAVVVGVGDDEDFADMEELDADATVLRDNDGKAAVRDIVQFVKYADFKELGMRELALEVLGEVPDQFVDYQVMTQELPEMLYQFDNPGETPFMDFAPGEVTAGTPYKYGSSTDNMMQGAPLGGKPVNQMDGGISSTAPINQAGLII